jgi:hypothetical protein
LLQLFEVGATALALCAEGLESRTPPNLSFLETTPIEEKSPLAPDNPLHLFPSLHSTSTAYKPREELLLPRSTQEHTAFNDALEVFSTLRPELLDERTVSILPEERVAQCERTVAPVPVPVSLLEMLRNDSALRELVARKIRKGGSPPSALRGTWKWEEAKEESTKEESRPSTLLHHRSRGKKKGSDCTIGHRALSRGILLTFPRGSWCVETRKERRRIGRASFGEEAG